MSKKRFLEGFKTWYWVLPIFGVSLIYILNSRFFSSPPIYSDDWMSVVANFVSIHFGYVDFLSSSPSRPFAYALINLVTSIIGLHLQYFYILNFFIIFLSATLLYLIIKTAFPQFSWLGLPAAILFLIYPADFTKTWLITSTEHFILLIDFVIVLLLINYAKSGKLWEILLALLIFFLSLGVYEGGFGIVIVAAILLAVFSHKISLGRKISLLLPVVIGGFYIFWRFMILPHMSNADDTYIHLVNISVSVISFRYLRGLIVFILGWLGPIFSVRLGDFILDELHRHYIVAFAITGLIIVGCIFYFVRRFGIRSWKKVLLWRDRNLNLSSILVIFLVGGLFWAAGYVPVITIYSPGFRGMGTRDNLFASAGASLALIAGISFLIYLIDKSLKNVRIISIVSILPLLILGSLYQISAQREIFSAWDEQKQFWSLMFKAIPGLEKNSNLIIVIPGYSQLGEYQIFPFGGNWEAESALSVLYNDPSLNAVYYYPDRSQSEDNVLKSDQNWSNCVFVYYDPTKSTVEILQDPEKEISLPFQMSGYNPDKRIVTQSFQSELYRWLVK